MPWTLARRAERLNPSVIREILKVTERPGIISLAGGLPAADGFPVQALREAADRVLAEVPREAMQYAPSEGYGPLREWIAADMAQQGLQVSADQVLITTGSQQGLDLCAKVLVDPGSAVAVESPTYLGALQAFAPYEPQFVPLACDEEGPLLPLPAAMHQARFLYLVPSFQNPSGRCMSEARRDALVQAASHAGVPMLEDNPYGDLWYDVPPPRPLAARDPQNTIYLGSFSKVLAPGLRLGYVIAPPELFPKLLQAKQAADLHTPGFNQRIVYQVVRDGFLQQHLPQVRARYKAQRDAMEAALSRYLAPLDCRWHTPAGGMFYWLTLPGRLDAMALLPQAVLAGVAYVPGVAFYCADAASHTLRLSFATAAPECIDEGVQTLGAVLRQAMESWPAAGAA